MNFAVAVCGVARRTQTSFSHSQPSPEIQNSPPSAFGPRLRGSVVKQKANRSSLPDGRNRLESAAEVEGSCEGAWSRREAEQGVVLRVFVSWVSRAPVKLCKRNVGQVRVALHRSVKSERTPSGERRKIAWKSCECANAGRVREGKQCIESSARRLRSLHA